MDWVGTLEPGWRWPENSVERMKWSDAPFIEGGELFMLWRYLTGNDSPSDHGHSSAASKVKGRPTAYSNRPTTEEHLLFTHQSASPQQILEEDGTTPRPRTS